jgi:hypothetical protein
VIVEFEGFFATGQGRAGSEEKNIRRLEGFKARYAQKAV